MGPPCSCHVSPNSRVQWSWPRANWIHGRVWCEILPDRSAVHALERCSENMFFSSSQGGGLMRTEHGWTWNKKGKKRKTEDKRNTKSQHISTPKTRTQLLDASGVCWGLVRETSGKCVVAAATGGFRGFGELRPVSISGSSWHIYHQPMPTWIWIMLNYVEFYYLYEFYIWYYMLIDLPPTTFITWSCGVNLSTDSETIARFEGEFYYKLHKLHKLHR